MKHVQKTLITAKLRLRNADEMSGPLQNSRFAVLNSAGASLLPPQNHVP